MKRLLLLIFVSAICAMAFPQKVTGDKSAICKILTKEHKCRVVVQDISKKYNETITTWGYRQGYTSTPLYLANLHTSFLCNLIYPTFITLAVYIN